MLATSIYVALGGAIGAVARFGLGVVLVRPGFPLGVMTANVLGGFLMGLAVVYLGQRGLSQWTPFVMTGVLGGFTTFSAFSLEAYTLFERGAVGQAAVYVLVSVAASIAALIAGVWLMRSILA